jgi:hypothetical protein
VALKESMRVKGKRRAPRGDAQREKEATTERRWWFLGGGAAFGAGLISVGKLLSPWLLAVLWLVASGMVSYGVTAVTSNKWVRGITALAALVVAFSLWQRSSAHAVIQVASVALVSASDEAMVVKVQFQNVGDWVATYVHAATARAVPMATLNDQEGQRLLEDEVHASLEAFNDAAIRPAELPPNVADRPVFINFAHKPTSDELAAFDNGQNSMLFMGQLRYHDWWRLQQRVTEYCWFLSKDEARRSCSRFNGSR